MIACVDAMRYERYSWVDLNKRRFFRTLFMSVNFPIKVWYQQSFVTDHQNFSSDIRKSNVFPEIGLGESTRFYAMVIIELFSIGSFKFVLVIIVFVLIPRRIIYGLHIHDENATLLKKGRTFFPVTCIVGNSIKQNKTSRHITTHTKGMKSYFLASLSFGYAGNKCCMDCPFFV